MYAPSTDNDDQIQKCLVTFCQAEGLIIANSLFKQPKRKLYTWKSSRDIYERIVGNQIDFFLIEQTFCNSILLAKTLRADIG